MTYIKLLDDMRLIVTWADEIYRGDNMSSAIPFLFPLRVGTIDVAASTVFLNYIGADGVPDTVILEPCERMYDDRHYQYAIPVTCKLSANPGEVTMWLQFYTGDAEHPTIKNSGECKIRILDSQDIDGCDHEDQNTVIYQFKENIEKLGEALRYTPQELTPEQQAQARANIGVTDAKPQVQVDMAQNDPEAVDYIKNRLAWTEKREPFIFDGDATGHIYDGTYLSILPQWDLSTVTSVSVCLANTGDTLTFSKGDAAFVFEKFGNAACIRIEGLDLICNYPDSNSTAVLYNSSTDGTIYVSRVEFEGGEIVHKIDPKYYDRVAWFEGGYTAVLPETTVELNGGQSEFGAFPLNVGGTYCVELDGVQYEGLVCNTVTENDAETRIIGNGSLAGISAGDSTAPFLIGVVYEGDVAVASIILAYTDNTLQTPLTGQHTIAVFSGTNVPHRMDKRLLPEGVSIAPDYDQCDPTAEDYIKNRPCYSGVKIVDTQQAIEDGATSYIFGEAYGIKIGYVKVHDYVPFDDWVYNITVLSSAAGCDLFNHYGYTNHQTWWKISNMDDIPVVGISQEAIESDGVDLFFSITEPGIYMETPVILTASIPLFKKLEQSMIDLEWSRIEDCPFGDFEGKRITSSWSDKSVVAIYDGTTTFKRIHPDGILPNDIIGAELILSNGATKTVTVEDITIIGTNETDWIIENLLISNNGQVPLSVTSNADRRGLYSSDVTGAYVTEIRLPGTTKQLDEKFIPDSIARVSDLPTSDAIDVLLTKLN